MKIKKAEIRFFYYFLRAILSSSTLSACSHGNSTSVRPKCLSTLGFSPLARKDSGGDNGDVDRTKVGEADYLPKTDLSSSTLSVCSHSNSTSVRPKCLSTLGFSPLARKDSGGDNGDVDRTKVGEADYLPKTDLSSSTLSVCSHGNSTSVRPKCLSTLGFSPLARKDSGGDNGDVDRTKVGEADYLPKTDLSSSTLSVCSHGNSTSVRPKCP